MKIIDILNKKLNGTLVDGFEFLYDGSYYAYFKKVDEIQDIVTGTNIGAIYELDKILSDEVEVIEEEEIEEEIEEIDELRIARITTEEMESEIKLKEVLNDTLYDKEKINELVRAVNKINKQLEEQQTEDIDTVERELNKMF